MAMSKYKSLPKSIIEGSPSIGAAVSLGIKESSRGFPIEKDRFHIVMPHEADGRRPHHPAFAAFNNAKPEHRRMLRGIIMSAEQGDCFEYYFRAQTEGRKAKMHPKKIPFCQSDGVTATRWVGGDEFKEMPCLNEKCQYRTCTPPACSPYMRLMFMLRWSEDAKVKLPSMVVTFTSKSWSTTNSAAGLFNQAVDILKNLGAEPNLFGLPFTMTLAERTNSEKRSRYPTVKFALDGDVMQFALARAAAVKGISEKPLALPQSEETEYLDYEAINVELPK